MLLSVDLSSSVIHMALVNQTGRGIRIEGFASAPTPEGCIKNGIVVNATMLGQALRGLAHTNGFKEKKLAFAVTSPAISYHEFTVPVTKNKKELEQLLFGETNQLIVSQKEILMDYVVLEEYEDVQQGGRFYRTWCTIVPKALVEGYWEAAVKGGFTPQRCDVVGNAAYKAHLLYGSNERTTLYAGMREDELCLSLFEGSANRFYRNVAVSAPKNTVENEFILSSIVSEGTEDESSRQQRLTEAAIGQISKLLQFQMMRNKEKPVEQIYLCSDLAKSEKLKQAIFDALHIPVVSAHLPASVVCDTGFVFGEYLYTVGAAMK